MPVSYHRWRSGHHGYSVANSCGTSTRGGTFRSSAPPIVDPAPAGIGTGSQCSGYKNAITAGYGAYVAGVDPEYHWYGDGDSDGINCA